MVRYFLGIMYAFFPLIYPIFSLFVLALVRRVISIDIDPESLEIAAVNAEELEVLSFY